MNFFDKESNFLLRGEREGYFFYKLTRNPNLSKNLLFCGGWVAGVKGGGGG